jgi:hypothetical protein
MFQKLASFKIIEIQKYNMSYLGTLALVSK